MAGGYGDMTRYSWSVPVSGPKIEPGRFTPQLGGFLGREGDGEPGVKTICLGLQRVMDFAAGIKCARQAHVL